MEKDNKFEYTYSAQQQAEIEAIRKKYMPATEDKVELLRKLDKSVESKGTAAGIALGVIGTLAFGTGMSLSMVWTANPVALTLGIILGIIGIVLIAAAYPVFRAITNKQREKIAPQIIALSDELLKS